jgi:hypothetical protein
LIYDRRRRSARVDTRFFHLKYRKLVIDLTDAYCGGQQRAPLVL